MNCLRIAKAIDPAFSVRLHNLSDEVKLCKFFRKGIGYDFTYIVLGVADLYLLAQFPTSPCTCTFSFASSEWREDN